MIDPTLLHRQRTLLQTLHTRSAERAAAEVAAETGFRERKEAIEKELQAERQRIQTGLESERTAVESEYQQVRQDMQERFYSDQTATQKEYDSVRQRLTAQQAADQDKADKKYQETRWSVGTVYDANKSRLEERKLLVEQQTGKSTSSIGAIKEESVQLMEDAGLDPDFDKAPAQRSDDKADPLDLIKERILDARDYLDDLRTLKLLRLFTGERFLGWVVLSWFITVLLLAGVLAGLTVSKKIAVNAAGWPRDWHIWLISATVATAVIAGILHLILRARLRGQTARLYPPLRQALAEAAGICQSVRKETIEAYPRLVAENEQRQTRDLQQVDEKYQLKVTELGERFEQEMRTADEKYPRLLADVKNRNEQELEHADEKYPRLLADIKKRFEAEARQVQQRHKQQVADNDERHQTEWNSLTSLWRQALADMRRELAEIQQTSEQLFPGWPTIDADLWPSPAAVPSGLRFGELEIRMEKVPQAVPADPRLSDDRPSDFTMPALLGFPNNGSLLLKTSNAGREQAIRVLQAVMLRYLTSLPPGKVRFTIVDPVGLGENFASFMHLADYQEAFVTNRIWTEPQHIEQRLIDLTEHMENVIQKYLRNQFASIEEYNVQAGEVAEPYRILVIADFPVNFSEAAVRRLLSIAGSGASSGVATLISIDTRQPLPHGCNVKDLEKTCPNLIWREGAFVWKDEDFGKFALRLDQPPADDACTRILHRVGARAKDAGRVEVPFEFIAPQAERYWTQDSRQGIDVALGRAGATKLQHLQLGLGTSQHVLIAGKTGSGKSTLLHALITNLALNYSPDEVEFYLIDFKKGVEFKTYAALELPHARVVAIESDREFGLSVLQRLDVELRQRGELFRTAGVQDINSYRQTNGATRLPRILLIVDEFQEYFVEDDKIAADVSLLLDRLVRQGRAFGIHVLLGSQTLGGAYSLARSTLGQMAVRIALQCSEADANLILSEENGAARLLSRPGEAIYNDANGRVEGNNFFQVVWLPEVKREKYLHTLHDLRRQRSLPTRSQIVFEGNAPADIRVNSLLARWLEAPRGEQKRVRAFHAWLGEPMAIKDPTAAVFRPQSGSNMIVIGQQDEPALAILATAMIGLAAQQQPGESTRFFVVDGSPVDDPHVGYLEHVAQTLPMPIKVGGFRELPAILAEVAAEVERRQRENDHEAAPIFLFIHGLQRLRDLRKAEDDFGFGRDDKPASPSQQFGTIIREGPGASVYTLLWCDSLNNVNRALDRQGMREFELRVLFQMSVADSSVLIDSPAASKLGMNHALYYTEERGQPEKFRPYGLPPEEWLAQVKEQLSTRAAALARTGEA